jgi:hypothetical protein
MNLDGRNSPRYVWRSVSSSGTALGLASRKAAISALRQKQIEADE